MAKFFGRLFGKTEKEEPFQRSPVVAPDLDPEYVAYCVEKDQVITALEENLHTSDDPHEIAMKTLEVACSFYGGDWKGFLRLTSNWMSGIRCGGITRAHTIKPCSCSGNLK